MNYMKKQSIGCDIEDIDRFRGDNLQNNKFLDRIFTAGEQRYCFSFQDPAPHLAVRFCAKEAIIKAFYSLNHKPPSYLSIEIKNANNGVPYVILYPEKDKPEWIKDIEVQISLSHSNTMAMGISIIIKTE